MTFGSRVVVSVLVLGALSIAAVACGDGDIDSDGATDTGAGDGGAAMSFGDPAGEGLCKSKQQSFASPPRNHVPVGTVVEYVTNPPCGGPHYPIWASFKEYANPVDRRYYVHSEEHGAVVLAYKCDSATACPAEAAALREIRDALPDDPLCSGFVGTKNRIIITPDPLLERPIGVAAWGFSYTADCIDAASIRAFIDLHYAHGVENLCNPGMETF